MRALLVFALSLSAAAHAGDKLIGKGYKLGSDRKELLFVYEWVSTDSPGKRTEIATYRTPDLKETLVVEEAVFNVGADNKETLQTYRIEQRQIASVGSIDNGPAKRIYKYTVDGKTKDNKEDIAENFVVSSTLIAYLVGRWDQITAGKKVLVEYGIVDRRRSVEFQLFKESTKPDGRVVVKMVPTSFFVRTLVDPLYFEFSADGKTLHSMRGLTEPKIRVGDSFEDLEAEVVYQPTK